MFSEQFAFRLPATINFVGGGGKTALILKLAEEYSSYLPVIYTTTVRIHPPHPSRGLALVACDDPDLLRLFLEGVARNCLNSVRTFAGSSREKISSPGLLRGVDPDFAQSLDPGSFPIVLNEADGARSISLKMPRAGEPVLMAGADYLVPVIGLDCINKPLGPKTLFRWEAAAGRYSLRPGQLLSPELAASLLLHREGVCKDWKEGMQILPYINKADTARQEKSARALAYALLQNEVFPVQRVVWGSLRKNRVNSITAGTI